MAFEKDHVIVAIIETEEGCRVAVMPGVNYQPVPGLSTLMRRYDVVCVHTIVGRSPAPAAHFSTDGQGRIIQSRDTKFQSAANLNGNYRVISIENEDKGPDFPPWSGGDIPALTAAQCESIARICAWANAVHGIPLVLCPDSRPSSRGIGYHRQGVDGNFGGYAYGGRVPGGENWSKSFGKTCIPLDTTEVLTADGWLPLMKVAPDTQVASVSTETGVLSFGVTAQIEPFEAEVVDLGGYESTLDHDWVVWDASLGVCCSCGYTGTPRGVRNHAGHGTRRGERHQVVRTGGWRNVKADQVTKRSVTLPIAGSTERGLGYSLSEIRLLVWAQGDGHYRVDRRGKTTTVVGVEWHLFKERKINRLEQVLQDVGLEYRKSLRADGTVSIRVYGSEARRLIVDRLPEKRFDSSFLTMSTAEAGAFLDELIKVDGNAELNCYFTMDAQCADVVQAVATMHGRVTSLRVPANGLHWVRFLKRPVRIRPTNKRRTTQVGCVTTKDGTLVVRQNGRVVVTGNCPGDRRIRQTIEIIIPRAIQLTQGTVIPKFNQTKFMLLEG